MPLIAAGIPMLTLILTALTRGPGVAPVPANWTLANFAAGFSGGAGVAVARSAGLALAAAVVAPLLGTGVAALARGRWRGPLATVVTLAYAIPGSASRSASSSGMAAGWTGRCSLSSSPTWPSSGCSGTVRCRPRSTGCRRA